MTTTFAQHFLKYKRNAIWVFLGPNEFRFQLTTARLVSFSVPNMRCDKITKVYGGKVISLDFLKKFQGNTIDTIKEHSTLVYKTFGSALVPIPGM